MFANNFDTSQSWFSVVLGWYYRRWRGYAGALFGRKIIRGIQKVNGKMKFLTWQSSPGCISVLDSPFP